MEIPFTQNSGHPPKLRNIHPGEVLREEFLIPLGVTQLTGVLAQIHRFELA